MYRNYRRWFTGLHDLLMSIAIYEDGSPCGTKTRQRHCTACSLLQLHSWNLNSFKLHCVYFTCIIENLEPCVVTNRVQGQFFWTAGQRTDPTRNSPFIWRVISTETSDQQEYPMTYTNWAPAQPDFLGLESCMHLWTHRGFYYTWNDRQCYRNACFICEIDMHCHK